MPTIIFPVEERKTVARCGGCFELRVPKYRTHPQRLAICEKCSYLKNLVKISAQEYKAYKAIIAHLGKPNYCVLAAKQSGFDRRYISAVASDLRKRGIDIPKVNLKNQIRVNSRGEKVALTPRLAELLDLINSEKLTLCTAYVTRVAEILKVCNQTITYNINTLQKMGFNITSSERRTELLRQKIKELAQSGMSRSNLFRQISEIGYCSKSFVVTVLLELRQQGISVKDTSLEDLVEREVFTPKTLKELTTKFPGYSRYTVYAAIRKLKEKRKIVAYRPKGRATETIYTRVG